MFAMQQEIPETLAPFFQEYNFANLNAERDVALVIERTLAFGNREELRWLFTRYGSARIRDWIQYDGARRLPLRAFLAWQTILEIPSAELSKPTRGVWAH